MHRAGSLSPKVAEPPSPPSIDMVEAQSAEPERCSGARVQWSAVECNRAKVQRDRVVCGWLAVQSDRRRSHQSVAAVQWQ
jgi:hypothetical protein